MKRYDQRKLLRMKKALKKKEGREPETKKKDAEGKGLKESNEKEEVKQVSPKEKKKLTEQAIAEIRQGVSKIGVQKAGAPFVPPDWSEKYKPILGPYKQFLKDHSDEFVLVTEKSGDFIIRLPDQLDPPSIPDKKVWEKHLLKAWMQYCKVVPREGRDFRHGFLSVLPKTALATAKSAKVPPQSPILTPKSPGLSFAAEPSMPNTTKKGKRKADEKDSAGSKKKKLKKKAA